MEPDEFKAMVDDIHKLEIALGSSMKEVVDEEAETVYVQRRGLYAKNDVKQGEVIKAEDIDVLRPALGIPPKFEGIIAGKVANKDIAVGEPIYWADIQ